MAFLAALAASVLFWGVTGVSDYCRLEEGCFKGEVAIRNISGVNSIEKCCTFCNGLGDQCAAWTVDYDKNICHLFNRKPRERKRAESCDAGSPSSPPGSPSAPSSIKVEPLPRSLAAYRRYFTKYVPIFGIPILAESGVPDWMVEHAGNIMAQYLDYTADGRVDNEAVLASMKRRRAMLVMFVDPDSKASQKAMDAVGEGGQDLDKDDIPSWAPRPPNASVHLARVLYASRLPRCSAAHRRFHKGALRGCSESRLGVPLAEDFDASLEEILHLITDNGYAAVYPHVFSTHIKNGYSQIAVTMNDMVNDCGWAYNHTLKYPGCSGKYHYSDETCDYECLVTEYTMWSLTSILGGQDGSHNDALKERCRDIANEWQLCTEELVKKLDSQAYAIFDVHGKNQYKVPNKLPNGAYRPALLPVAEAMALDAAYYGPTHVRLGTRGSLFALADDADVRGASVAPTAVNKCEWCERLANFAAGSGASKGCAAACVAAASATGPAAALLGAVCGKLCSMIEQGVCRDSRLDCAERLCQEIELCPRNSTLSAFVVV